MSVGEYSLNFILWSKYAPSLGSNHRDKMSRFLTDLSLIVKEVFCTAMIHGDMTYLGLWCIVNPFKSLSLGGVVEMLSREELISMFNLGLRKGFQIKIVLVLLRPTMRELLVLKVLSLLVLLLGRSTLGNV